VLRIDETSNTLVAPDDGGIITERPPERDALLAMITASWEAFAGELGMPTLRLAAPEPAPGIDLIAYDEDSQSVVVLQVTGDTVEWQLSRDLAAAAVVAGWDAEKFASVSDVLAGATPGASPRLVLIAGAFDPSALATTSWLTRRHGVQIACCSLRVLRFGSERLLTVTAEPADGEDAAADFAAQLGAVTNMRARRRWLRAEDDPPEQREHRPRAKARS
jgi:hypothetical protein